MTGITEKIGRKKALRKSAFLFSVENPSPVINLRKQDTYIRFGFPNVLEKVDANEYNFGLSIGFWLPSNRHVRQARVIRKAALRQEPAGHSPGETSLQGQPWSLRVNSLRHVPLRGTGWSRNPTSLGFAQRSRDQRVRRRTENSANTPSLLQRKRVFSARMSPPVCPESV